jgi:signal transduction histidine kinase
MSVTQAPQKIGESQRLANELFEARSKLRAAGRGLHDEVGPLLSAAGIRLDLLRADFPETGSSLTPVLVALEEAMDRVRAMSRELNPPPAAHLGLKKALSNLVEARQESFRGEIRFSYAATANPSHDVTAAIYESAVAVLARAAVDATATRILVSARGSRGLTVAIESDGGGFRWPPVALEALNQRARPAGVFLDVISKKGTIVSIRYAARRPSGG